MVCMPDEKHNGSEQVMVYGRRNKNRKSKAWYLYSKNHLLEEKDTFRKVSGILGLKTGEGRGRRSTTCMLGIELGFDV